MNNLESQREKYNRITKKIALANIKGLTDDYKGAYSYHHGISTINFNRENHLEALKHYLRYRSAEEIISEMKNAEKSSKFPFTLLHEQRHALHTTGSTLGSTFHIAAQFQHQIMGNIIFHLKNNKPLDYIKNKHEKEFLKIQNLVNFFDITHYYDSDYDENCIRKIKDHSSSILWMGRVFFDIFKKKYKSDVKTDIILMKLQKALEDKSEMPLPLNTHSIIESYGLLCLYFVDLMYNKLFSCNDISSSKKEQLSEEFLNALIKSYHVTPLETLKREMAWIIEERGYFDFFYTCMAVFELSLMTSFHPLLLFKSQEIRLDDIIVPLRFQKIIDFFNEEKTTISNYCNVFDEQWRGFNDICENYLNMFSFSDCMNTINELYSSTPYCNTYYGELSRALIRRKTRKDTYNIAKLPTIIIYNDTIVQEHRKGIKEINIENNPSAKKAISDFLGWLFLTELFRSNNGAGFIETERLLNKIHSYNQSYVPSFLKESGIGNHLNCPI